MKTAIKRLFQHFGYDIRRHVENRNIWIDVGAHKGQLSFRKAETDSSVLVFAFEPNWERARELMGRLANLVVIPMAVTDSDGISDFFINVEDATSSLLPFEPEAIKAWDGLAVLRTEKQIRVPTIRLDTFLSLASIPKVEFLKIDTQGVDFSVIKSAGERLEDIRRITLEVDISPLRLYRGSASKDEIVRYMLGRGFTLNSLEANAGLEENLTFSR